VIDVAFTRAELRAADVAVVVDVLRATSTATQALASGYRRVLCAETIERALELRGPGRVLAGERHCIKPPGFDLGNSPTDTLERRGDELVLATTNGAPTIVAATGHAPRVLLACLLNLSAALRGPRTDAALVAEGVSRAFESPLEALGAGADARVLRQASLTSDIAYCALESQLDVVPAVIAAGAGVAVVTDREQRHGDGSEVSAVDVDATVKV
jgi:2-phosphosulfolactate phosphatase